MIWVIALFVCGGVIYRWYIVEERMNSSLNDLAFLTKENKKQTSEIKQLKKQIHDPTRHRLPVYDSKENNGHIVIVNNKKEAFQAFLYYQALKKRKEPEKVSAYIIYYNEKNWTGFTDKKKTFSYVVFNNDTNADGNFDYYAIIIRGIQHNWPFTAGVYYIYKDGYVLNKYDY